MAGDLPELVHFGREVCGDLAQAERREWWLSDGLGGYAGGTVAGSLTRRYHGLLITPVAPPLGRRLLLAKADATLALGDRRFPLYTNRWAGGAVDPIGHVHLESFRLYGRMPEWRFALGGLGVEMRIWMEPGRHCTYVAWRRSGAVAADQEAPRLRVALLAAARDHHHVSRPWDIDPRIEADGERMQVRYSDSLGLYLTACGGTFAVDPAWIERFDLPLERERGLEDVDNHLRVGFADLALPEGAWVGLAAGLEPVAGLDLPAAMDLALDRDRALLKRARAPAAVLAAGGAGRLDSWVEQLVLAADGFLFARPLAEVPDGESVIAGYPWFGDWGRDTMIALTGLTLATGRAESARRILLTFARFVDQGMLPNVFPGDGARPQYNSVDAALWYLEAWRAYVAATDDLEAAREAFPVLREIVRRYLGGTRHGIGVDPTDGLLRAGELGMQLTWMDVKIGEWVVTPRSGKPVEVNALWYNGLRAMEELAGRLGEYAAPFRAQAERVRVGFRRFVRRDGQGLLDVLDTLGGGDDASLRPNQILAVSLPHSPLEISDQAAVVRVCADRLLTSFGLRSLAPEHPDYRGIYLGGVPERDGAYHQGPVWTWLLGHYAIAEHRVTGDRDLALTRLAPLADHLRDVGLGTLGELFDGDPPHQPRGAPAQAWSVACALEALWRLRAIRLEGLAAERRGEGDPTRSPESEREGA